MSLFVHLALGDVAIFEDGRMLRVVLKQSQTDQWAGCTEFHLEDGRPLDAARTYVTGRDSAAGAFSAPRWAPG